MRRKRKQGFTLVELMVVAVIVAILAAVAIPLMSANRKRAMVTEAEAGLGTIRTALRGMYAETGRYDTDLDGNSLTNGCAPSVLPGIGGGDLDGRYFSDDDYVLTTLGSNTFTVTATGSSGDVAGVTVTLDQGGNFSRSGL